MLASNGIPFAVLFCLKRLLPLLILKDELPQLEVSQDQAVVVALCHGRCYLPEKSGSLVLAQLLAGAYERVHVPMAPLEEHVRPRLAQKDLHYLVNVLMGAQHEVCRQGLLISTDIKNLEKQEGTLH